MKKISLSIAVALFSMFFLNSCVDTDYAEPEYEIPQFEEEANITIPELKDYYTNASKEKGFATITDNLIVKGYVVSSDVEGNFYKNIVIQGELDASSEGIQISIDQSGLESIYPVGQLIYIKCKDLVLGEYGEEVQLGAGYYEKTLNDFRLAPISAVSVDAHIFLDGEKEDIQPRVISIDELTENNKYTYLKIENVQFTTDQNQTWANVGDAHNDAFPFKETEIIDQSGNKLTVFTSDYAKFAYKYTPTGSGSITGVLGYHNGSPQFIINSIDDVNMSGDRFEASEGDNTIVDPDAPTPNKNIGEILALYTGSVYQITDDFVFEGTVISNQGQSGNFYSQVYIQDATGGIQIRSYKSKKLDGLVIGQKIIVKARDLMIDKYKGVVQIGVEYNGGVGGMNDTEAKTKIFRNGPDENLTPNTILISDVNDLHVSTLVRFDQVQFIDGDVGQTLADSDGDFKFSENRTIVDANGRQMIVRTANTATFADHQIPNLSGSVTGVLSKYEDTWQLYIRNTDDLNLTETRF